jgi:alpha-beta hydrolase superfamily lysophospholipase
MFKEISFPSYNARDTVKGWIYAPIRKPKGIVQIAHGLGEHSRRYLHMILHLNEAGFVVAADDHVGHGKTAAETDTWGDYGDKGFLTTIEDEKSLLDLAAGDYPELPRLLFGHSWGSMIARGFAARYGESISGLIICGTCGVMALEDAARELKTLVDAGKGGERDPAFLEKMFAGWTSRYDNPLGPGDWISEDPDVVADHAADPFNNLYRPATNQANYDLACLVDFITGTRWAEKVPKNLPVFNIAGDRDPVGNYGEGVYQVSNWLWETGHKEVITKLYSGYRHEIHNSREIRDEVVGRIIAFALGVIESGE